MIISIIIFLILWLALLVVDKRDNGLGMILTGLLLAGGLYYVGRSAFSWQTIVCLSAIAAALGYFASDVYASRTSSGERQTGASILATILLFSIFVAMFYGNWKEHGFYWVIPVVVMFLSICLRQSWLRTLSLVLVVAMLLTMPSLVSWLQGGIQKMNLGQMFETSSNTEPEPESNSSQPWYGFYNLSLLKDEDETNDFNFGYNPMDFYPDWLNNPAKYDSDFRERMRTDVALGAAAMAWLDAKVGTRYLGEFYESCKGDWAKTINSAKLRFMADQDFYTKTLKAFFDYLDKAEMSVESITKKLMDQMYMNPYTVDGIPDVIVMKTNDHSGKYLVYTFRIKGAPVDVAYRIDCGYQPTNVQGVMGIEPVETPSKDGTSTSENPPPVLVKDPTHSTSVSTGAPNTAGAPTGSFTGDGNGGNKSTEDTSPTKPEERVESYKEYEENLDKETQGAGSTSGDKPEDKPADNPHQTEGAGGSTEPFTLTIP